MAKTFTSMKEEIQAHLSCDVDGREEQLIQVMIHHEARVLNQRVLKTGPDRLPQIPREL